MFIDYLAALHNQPLLPSTFGLYFETDKAVYIKSPTLMNVSANCLHAFEQARYLPAVDGQLCVACDDLDTRPGDVRYRRGGSAR